MDHYSSDQYGLDKTDPDAMSIIDVHCHIASGEHLPRSIVHGMVENMAARFSAQGVPMTAKKLCEMLYRKLQDPLCDELIDEMAEAGISKSIVAAVDYTYAIKDCSLTIEETFRRHHDVLMRHPGKLEIFAGVDPRWGKDGLDLFEDSLTNRGFRGFSVSPPCGFGPSDPGFFPYYELCARYGLPVLVHVGPSSSMLKLDTSNPLLLDEAARLFPLVNFILTQAAVNFSDDCAMMCRQRPNVYLEISGFQAAMGWDPDCKAVARAVSQGINHKVLFGTDWPMFRIHGDQQNFVNAVAGDKSPLSELHHKDKALVLHGNAERLFFPQPTAMLQ